MKKFSIYFEGPDSLKLARKFKSDYLKGWDHRAAISITHDKYGHTATIQSNTDPIYGIISIMKPAYEQANK